MILARRTLTDAVKTMLTSATARPGGVGSPPADAEMPYFVVYPIPGGGFSGAPLVAPNSDATVAYQVTSVGARVDQADWMADKVRGAFLDRASSGAFTTALTPPAGWRVMDREPYGEVPGADIAPSPSADANTVVSVPERFLIHLTPA